MILRVLALAGGVAGGTGLSQFPEYSQQYLQRLGGAVDALQVVVADFDASAQAEGLTRAAALEQMRGTAFLDRRRLDMTRTITRYEDLLADLTALEAASPYQRALNITRMTDREVAEATLASYAPAVPVTATGAIFAGAGFLGGLVIVRLLLAFLIWPFRRGGRQAA